MKLCYFMDRWRSDEWSGRRLDYDIWYTHMQIWGLSELAIINRAQIDLPTNPNVTIYHWPESFVEQTSGPYICLEHPKNNPDELLGDHTFNEEAWYVMGPVEGWHGKEIGSTLGIEQIGTAELHAPFVASVLCYNYFMRK